MIANLDKIQAIFLIVKLITQFHINLRKSESLQWKLKGYDK